MTDKELSQFGEKLYEAILVTPLPGGTIFAIASAIRHGTPWKALPGSLKLAVFKIATNCLPEGPAPAPLPGGEPGAADGEAPDEAVEGSDASPRPGLEGRQQDGEDEPTPEAA